MTAPAAADTATTDSSTKAGPGMGSAMGKLLVALAVAVAAIGGWSLSSRLMADSPAPVGLGPMQRVDQSTFAGGTGIWIEHVSIIGGGGLIEIRYRILDVDKSEVVHDTVNPPRLVTSDGLELRLQRMDHGHDRDNRLGTTYNEQLVNQGGQLQRGETVTVHVGEFELPGVVVQ